MLFSIDDSSPKPVYLQLAASVKEGIRSGALKPGDSLPSVRELARDLSINLHTARHAYQTLCQEGVIQLRLGRLARVAELRRGVAAKKEAQERIADRLKELASDAFLSGITHKQFKELVNGALKTKGQA